MMCLLWHLENIMREICARTHIKIGGIFSSCFLGRYLTIICSVDELVYNTAENMHPTFY